MITTYDMSFFDSLPGAIILSDNKTRVLYSNPVAEDILKIPRADLHRMRLFERVDPVDQQKVKQYAKVLKQTRHLVTLRRFKDGDGKYVFIERNSQLLEDGKQFSVCRLISPDEINENHKERETFASMAGHELKNPLAGIQLNLNLLETQMYTYPNNAHLKKTLGNTQYFIDMQKRMIGDLMNFSQLKKGKLFLQRSTFELQPFLSQILDQIGTTSERKFIFTISKHVPKFIDTDKDRLYQVCMNLLSNAVKFSKPPSPIEMHVDYKDGVCNIAVKDYGIGIEKDKLRQIFKDFYQIQPSESSGLGIGLYVSNEIIKLHHGKLVVESEGGNQGSTFTIHLPLESGDSRINHGMW